MYLYNTETRKKELLVIPKGRNFKIYTCGPTIYAYAHIGNFRTFVVEDVLRRALKFFGFPIEQVMNLTDVDDKTIRGAIQAKVTLKEFTEPFRIAFLEDRNALGLDPVEHMPLATDYIPKMIEMIERLLEKKIAYQAPSRSIYFSIKKFPHYGRLSHLILEELEVNASGDNEADEYGKENLSDFVLWKAKDEERDGQIFWESPFGPGRPGWHIECSAMATEILGPSLDLHCGGVDNMFPHHENEIAQSEGCNGTCFAKHWLHVEHLLVDHKKMSKSLGNFYTLRDLLAKGYTGMEVRYLLLSTHYRTQLNFTLEGLDAARAALHRIQDCLRRLSSLEKEKTSPSAPCIQEALKSFSAAIGDDLNTSAALAAAFELIRELNQLADQGQLGGKEATAALAAFAAFDQVLGVFAPPKEEEIPKELLSLLEQRNQARREKNFSRSDQLRDLILEKGYLIEDTPKGARLKKR